jgi:hypothetical protein
MEPVKIVFVREDWETARWWGSLNDVPAPVIAHLYALLRQPKIRRVTVDYDGRCYEFVMVEPKEKRSFQSFQ